MWQLKKVTATNICAFETLEYAPLQNKATLIFGNNQDSDSQNSNGSGKSALIEAIAIGLTGDTLRKVNMEEIINDRYDEATIGIDLSNDELGVAMYIDRKLSRKQPQEIIVRLQKGHYDTDTEEVKQATVADYNKYILDQIGLSKDDIFANFILTARKYKSFLSSSDKDKKEVINRFSNGVIVDESIEALHKDMEPIIEELSQAEKQVANCTGKVSALEGEIEQAINDTAERKASRQSRIDGIKKLIEDKQTEINKTNRDITTLDCDFEDLKELDEFAQKLEKSDMEALKAYSKLKNIPALNEMKDCAQEVENFQARLTSESAKVSELSDALADMQIKVQKLSQELNETQASNTLSINMIDTKTSAVDNDIKKLGQLVKSLRGIASDLNNERVVLQNAVAELQKDLAGVVECPKCRHEFTLSGNVDIEATRKALEVKQKALRTLLHDIKFNEEQYNDCVRKGTEARSMQTDLATQKHEIQEMYDRLYLRLADTKKEYANIDSRLETAKSAVNNLQGRLSNIRRSMFDEVFEIIDRKYKDNEQQVADLKAKVESLHGSISLYEEQIRDIENISDDDILVRLKNSKTKYESDLKEAVTAKEAIEVRLNRLKAQEATFVEFKTYLANTKINAIAQITNEFLATIGSDIRVALSGYTILKSGKVRDKISVSVLRDGIDCGSFEKFSAGERVRLELASILAMRQLTNVNAEDGKGLNLLICDEILDSSDESGLTNIFKALNETGVTSLVVSHGNVAEGYPNKLVVTKQNGVSFL